MLVTQSEYGSVVEHFAVIITPAEVDATANLEPGDVLGHDTRQEGSRIFSANLIFEQRADIDKTSRVSKRVVLTLMTGVVRANRVVTGPLLKKETGAEF
jgi:hypothetical protein